MKHEYKTKGVCAEKIAFDLEDGKIRNVEFFGGCDGNLKAISKLVEGKTVGEISSLLSGNTCGRRNTSCADQLARAISDAVKN